MTPHPYRHSLNGAVHLWGGDRRAVLMLIISVVGCIAVIQSIASVVVGVGLVAVGMPLLRRAYKTDPLLLDLTIRSVRWPGFLPGSASPFISTSRMKRF